MGAASAGAVGGAAEGPVGAPDSAPGAGAGGACIGMGWRVTLLIPERVDKRVMNKDVQPKAAAIIRIEAKNDM